MGSINQKNKTEQRKSHKFRIDCIGFNHKHTHYFKLRWHFNDGPKNNMLLCLKHNRYIDWYFGRLGNGGEFSR